MAWSPSRGVTHSTLSRRTSGLENDVPGYSEDNALDLREKRIGFMKFSTIGS